MVWTTIRRMIQLIAAGGLLLAPLVGQAETLAPSIEVENHFNGHTEILTLPGPDARQRSRLESPQPADRLAARPADAGVRIDTVATELITDLDADGYHSRFSVHFDANTYADERIWLYAKLYLSLEGGPWTLYAVSDDFLIEGDSLLDDYRVETTLRDGFPSGYYDVRIELYDADSDDWLLTWGPYDDGSLRNLPLEDDVHDDMDNPGYFSYSVSGGGGAADPFLALLLLGGLGLRRFRNRSAPARR